MARAPEPTDQNGAPLRPRFPAPDFVPGTVRGRPDDVPTWGECWRATFKQMWWMVPAMYVIIALMVHFLPGYLYEPHTAAQRATVAQMSDTRGIAAMSIAVTPLLVLIFIMTTVGVRSAETPKEREARELRQLQALKAKYPNAKPVEPPVEGRVVDGRIVVWDKGTDV